MQKLPSVMKAVAEAADDFQINPKDFLSPKEGGGSSVTQIAQLATSLAEAAQVLNSGFTRENESGISTNVISPVVMPKDNRTVTWLLSAAFLAVIGLIGFTVTAFGNTGVNWYLFGLNYWLIWLGYVVFSIWRNSFVEIPDGCQALITRFGKVEEIVGPGRKNLWNPWKKVAYIVNTTKEYPYNAPIRQAPTQGRVEASVDLFLQFKIEDPSEFIFTLGGAQGFSEKLHNVISEVTRALIYEQKAEEIYDLVGESTQSLLDNLNRQFLPAVRFVSANITHAEPASQEYRMDLAAAEIIRVAKEAYTYEYQLNLRKEQDEGDLNKELASLREQLSEIKAEIATYQAQIDTAKEKAVNRADAYAQRLLIEAKSEAKANAALLEAQALDIRALNSARYPEILEYRFQQETLDKMGSVADKLPQIINIGPADENEIDFMKVARQMLGTKEKPLYTSEELKAIQAKMSDIQNRIKARQQEISSLTAAEEQAVIEGVEV
ncbi:MAG: SPFH domain-containing protein [Anaerolineae bacterium]|nr:SPFH domain-containing protein [Anaerolineae bacterium]